jgi:hypothetical protein
LFIYTAKFSKKRAVIAVLILGIVLTSVILLVGSRHGDSVETSALSAVVRTNEDRVAYLEGFGWKVNAEPIETQNVIIPKTFDGVYETYNALQIQQGFDLSAYGGMEATRYTYQITNYPNSSDQVVADIVVYRNRVIAGDVQSTALDGFMDGLAFPK